MHKEFVMTTHALPPICLFEKAKKLGIWNPRIEGSRGVTLAEISAVTTQAIADNDALCLVV